MNTPNSKDDREVKIWYEKQLKSRRDYLEILLKRGYSEEQVGFDILKQLESILKEIKTSKEN